MKAKIFALLLVLTLFVSPILAEEPIATPPADQPAAAAPANKPADGAELPPGEMEGKLDSDTITKLMADIVAAAGQKGSFWRNPGLFDLVFTLLTVILGALAVHFGLRKKKWWKIIQAVEKAVNTVYVEFIRDLKLKNKESGGKLTADQMKEALDRAWNLTKADLEVQGIDLAKWIAKEYFPVVVDKILKMVK